jgi:hypothetical protein
MTTRHFSLPCCDWQQQRTFIKTQSIGLLAVATGTFPSTRLANRTAVYCSCERTNSNNRIFHLSSTSICCLRLHCFSTLPIVYCLSNERPIAPNHTSNVVSHVARIPYIQYVPPLFCMPPHCMTPATFHSLYDIRCISLIACHPLHITRRISPWP